MRQKTEWGYIDWEYLPDPDNPKRWFSVGLSTILPGKCQPPHIHYSNEQVLYVLKGQVTSKINGEEYHFKPGDYIALEADVTHEAVNTGDEPFTEIMITNPLPGGEDHNRGITRAIRRNRIDPELDEANRKKLNIASETLKDSILKNNSIPYGIFDTAGDVVIKNDQFPPICSANCHPEEMPKNCACFSCEITDGKRSREDVITYICPQGIKSYLIPILMRDRIVGILRGGHHFSSEGREKENQKEESGEFYDTPYATELSIIKALQRIAGNIKNCLILLDSTEDLEKKKRELNASLKKNIELEQNLVDIEDKITNLKINHHFLFNTLNCMAGMALDGDRIALYQSIIDLSKMFRYTMATDTQIVMLSREIEHLKSYLNLQKLRYEDGLILEYDIDESCMDEPVPFNFLQPIAENAFTHSFMNYDYDKRVNIRVEDQGDMVKISISNNGNPPKTEDLERIEISWASGSGHGLSLIYDKLHSFYGDGFRMDISAGGNGAEMETKVTIHIPKE